MMIIGVVFLLHQFYVIDVVMPKTWYMAIPVGYGLIRLLSARSAEDVGSGVGWALMGLWAWACMAHWKGLSFGDSWPIPIAAIGLSMVIKALPSLLPERSDPEQESDDDDGEEPRPVAGGTEARRNHA